MTDVREFRLPDVGEGLVEAEIVSWKVKPGDSVKVNDIIVEIETAKSLVELPSPYTGVISDLLVPEGQVVPVGTPIIRVSASGGTAAAAGSGGAAASAASGEENGERQAVLVGYGARAHSTTRRPRKQATSAPSAAAAVPAQAAPEPVAPAPASTPTPAPAPAPEPARASVSVLAKPPVRKLAKDLGVDLRQVPPTGPNGTVSRADVEAFAGAPAASPAPTPAVVAAPGERETRVPVRGLRRSTAAAVTKSAFTAPHVSEWITVDVTASMELLERLRARREFADLKVSPLVLVAKACCLAIRRTPEVNAVWSEPGSGSGDSAEIVLRNYVNLGIAAATSRGLLVPHVKDADRMSLPELARSISSLAQTAREGKTPPSDLQGTTFTITNVGVFGVDGGTPILNPGETGILAVGTVSRRPWVVEVDGVEQVVPRWVTTLSLSFDHRVVDGEQGSRFLTDVAGILSDPGLAMIMA
ncbi:dihydrolipoamide acetyltransferase family protein [Flindersiella endophytica]